MACDICKYGPYCRRPNLNDKEELREKREYFYKRILPPLVVKVAAFSYPIRLDETFWISDLIRWEQRNKGFDSCFEANYVVA